VEQTHSVYLVCHDIRDRRVNGDDIWPYCEDQSFLLRRSSASSRIQLESISRGARKQKDAESTDGANEVAIAVGRRYPRGDFIKLGLYRLR